jgi:hypothetical protein
MPVGISNESVKEKHLTPAAWPIRMYIPVGLKELENFLNRPKVVLSAFLEVEIADEALHVVTTINFELRWTPWFAVEPLNKCPTVSLARIECDERSWNRDPDEVAEPTGNNLRPKLNRVPTNGKLVEVAMIRDQLWMRRRIGTDQPRLVA